MSRRFDNFSQRLTAGLPAANTQDVRGTEDFPAPPAEPEAEPTTSPDPEEEPDMTTDTPVEQTEAYQAGEAAGRKAATDRMNAVFASEHFAGREAKAAKYLGTDMSAEQITTVLADLPAAQPVDQAAVTAAAEEAAREQMNENMNRTNADLGTDQKPKDWKTGRAAADAVWDRAAAKVEARRKGA
ncbi:hypothetical protein [Novosphingobium gossypii]|uniref:hypothetical protein n=1 Tax=Novosphingobium gossypii TaxID=1604774 RepID=UPI003D1BB753